MMNSTMRRASPWLLVAGFLGFLFDSTAHADGTVRLAAAQRAPYIGEALPGKGYVFEVAQEAFKRKGYQVKVEFYTLARAAVAASQGQVDGIVPVDKDAAADDSLVYSNPFPGDALGLLKKKALQLAPNQGKLDKLLDSLRPYKVGLVRGAASPPAFAEATYLAREEAVDDLENLDKLSADRIQLALIDRYTAADLMVEQRPQLIDKLEFVGQPLARRDFRVGFSKKTANHPQLLAAFNSGLAAMVKDGTLAKIQARHGLLPPRTAGGDKIELVIGTVNNGDMLVMQELAREYQEQHPNVTLKWRVLDEATLRVRTLSDLALSDGQFDVVTIGTYETPIWAKRGWLSSLQDMPASYDSNDLLPTVKTALSHEGQLFAAPFYAESSMTFYRKDLFAKARLSMPARPNYDDIEKFAAALHDPKAGVYGICLRGKAGWGDNMAIVGTLANGFGGRWFDEAWRPELSSPEWNKAVSYYVDLLNNYGPPKVEDNSFNETLKLFADGHCGIWIDATVAAGMLFDPKRSKVAGQLGFAPAPVGVTSKGTAWLWSWALAIPKSSGHKQEARDFIAWATSKDYIQRVAKAKGWVAVPPGTRKSTYQNENYVKAAPFSRFVLEAIEGADTRDSTLKPKPYRGIQFVDIPEFTSFGGQTGAEIMKALKKEQSVDTALSKAQHFVLRNVVAK